MCSSDLGRATFSAHGGIRYAYVTDAPANTALVALDANGNEVGRGTTDRFGSLIVRGLTPAGGFRFQTAATPRTETNTFAVLDEHDAPPASLYRQTLQQGINYVTVRDGIELAMTVRLPAGKTLSDGPFPTVVEYSGYGVAAPGDLLQSVQIGRAHV